MTFTRIDTSSTLEPNRFPSSVSVDESNPNHAIVTYSGYSTTTPAQPGHVFDVVFDPTLGTATWTDISNDIGDQPVLDSQFDSGTGDTYVSTDFGVNRLVSGTHDLDPGGRRPADGHGLGPEAHVRQERFALALRGDSRPRRLPAEAQVGATDAAAAAPSAAAAQSVYRWR